MASRAPAGRGLLLLLAFLAPGCDWIDDLTGPSVPDVAGTYSGPLIFSATMAEGGETLTFTANGTMTAEVGQDGDKVGIGGSFTIEGDTVAIEAVPGTIDGDGQWMQDAGTDGGFIVDDGCDRTVDSAIWFWPERKQLVMEMGGSSDAPTMECPDVTFSARLERG
ncbi:MAG: hypothetical protein OXR82_19905 [Gammaproteobacteria bacterium]|nr:hypothetical protein [Gammaproteobacteria bacterium]MDE0260638.1 hypothetical protein [Gammaproteobacteria bacterium]